MEIEPIDEPRIERERARRGDVPPSATKTNKYDRRERQMSAAFARAERQDAELRRLKATGEPWSALDYHPELL